MDISALPSEYSWDMASRTCRLKQFVHEMVSPWRQKQSELALAFIISDILARFTSLAKDHMTVAKVTWSKNRFCGKSVKEDARLRQGPKQQRNGKDMNRAWSTRHTILNSPHSTFWFLSHMIIMRTNTDEKIHKCTERVQRKSYKWELHRKQGVISRCWSQVIRQQITQNIVRGQNCSAGQEEKISSHAVLNNFSLRKQDNQLN